MRVLKALRTFLAPLFGLLLAALVAVPVLPAAGAPAGTATAIYPMVVEDLGQRVAGRPSDFTAVLVAGESPVPNQALSLWIRPEGSADFVEAGQAITDTNGAATVWATLERNASVQWRFAGGGDDDASTSTTYAVGIAPRITARVNDRTLRPGRRLVVTGRTFPVKAGCAVTLWKGELRPLAVGPAPVRLARATVRADGSYRLVRRFHTRSRMRVAVVVRACAGNARGLSPYVGIRIR